MLAGREEQGPGESVLCRSIKAPARPAAVRPAALHRSASARTLPRVLSHLPGLRITLTVGVVALVVAGALGYLIGHGNRSSVFKVGAGLVYATPNEGTAYLGANEPLNRQPTGFAYSFPPDITWTDRPARSTRADDHHACRTTTRCTSRAWRLSCTQSKPADLWAPSSGSSADAVPLRRQFGIARPRQRAAGVRSEGEAAVELARPPFHGVGEAWRWSFWARSR